MCLAVPGKIISIEGVTATVDVAGVQVVARLDLMDEVAFGDYVLVHAGFAITKLDADEAEETLALLQEAGRFG